MITLRSPAHGKPGLPWVTFALAAICLGLYVALGGTPDLLVYDRAAIRNGQWWRLVTGHLVHLDAQHLAFNTVALLSLGFLYETARFGGHGRLVFGVFGLGGAAVTATLFYGSPATLQYCGFSAVLNTLYAAVTIGIWRKTRQTVWLALLGLDLVKIIWEAISGPIFSTNLVWPPHVGAHLAGVTAGCALALRGILTQRAEYRRAPAPGP